MVSTSPDGGMMGRGQVGNDDEDRPTQPALPYSRTADAESVVLNLAKVLTYSRVLLYTLREGKESDTNTISVKTT
jgi:hypothetical protein